jgi:hypothetical protein
MAKSEADRLYEQFLDVPGSEELIEELYTEPIDLIRGFSTQSGDDISIRQYVGDIFELLAYAKVLEGLPKNQFAFSPSETDEVLEYLYSSRHKGGGQLNEIVPDGFVLEPARNDHLKLKTILEYKLGVGPAQPNIGKDRQSRQLMIFCDYSKVAATLGLSEPVGRDKFADILKKVRPGIGAKTVSLDQGYRVQYVVPANSQFTRESVVGLPPELFIHPNQTRRQKDSSWPDVNRRLAEPIRCSFSSLDFDDFFRRLRSDMVLERIQEVSQQRNTRR